MSETIFYRGDEPVPLPAAQTIRPSDKPSLAPRAAAEAPFVEMEYTSRSRNSRIGAPLGTGEWKNRWQTVLADAVQPPTTVLASADRFLAYGEMRWQLFDRQGHSIATAAVSTSGVSLDPEWKLVYSQDSYGRISAHSLADGKPAYTILPLQTNGMGRRLLARAANSLLSVSHQLPIDAHKADPQYSIAELTNLHGPDNRKSWSDPGGPALTHELVAHTAQMLSAMRAGTLAVAIENTLALIDAATLDPRTVLTGQFKPLALSIDEIRCVYLLVDTGGQTALWQISPMGERLYSCPMPPGFSSALAPPIVGYDHSVYLIRGRFILCVARDGKLSWSREAPSTVTGAVVTADDQLVTTEGSQIAAWNLKGERRIVHSFAEPLVTAPVVTKEGELLAASRTRLFCAGR